MAHNVKLDTLSMQDLTALIADAQKVLAEKADTKRKELLAEMAKLDELTGAVTQVTPVTSKPTRQRAPSEYVHIHPVSGHEWEGRGGIPEQWRDILRPDMSPEEIKAEKAKYRAKRKN